MRSRLVSLLGILLMTVALAAGAQGPTLAVTAATAKIDGVFEDREYSLVTEAAGIKLGLTRTPDTLFIGLSAPTTGWVSVGLGSRTMDGAIMYIGYISGATTELKVQKGSGHRHADVDAGSPLRYAMKEAGGQTVLELALQASEVIAKGQNALELSVAMGSADSFVSMHRARASLTVALAQ